MKRNNIKLTDIADFINGYAFKPSQWAKQGIPIIRIAQITGSQGNTDFYFGEELDKKLYINQGDILFPWSGTIMVSLFKQKKGILNQHIFKVVPKDNVDKKFLFYILEKNIELLKNKSHGMGMVHIKGSELKEVEVNIPESIEEQKRLANILTCVDKNIDITEQEIKKLEQIKIGLMNNLSKEASVTTLSNYVSFKNGYAFSTKDQSQEGIPWLKISNVGLGEIDWGLKDFLPSSFQEKFKNFILEKNDIVIALTRPVLGESLKIARVDKHPILLNQRVAKITLRNEIYNEFIFYFLQSKFCVNQILDLISGMDPPNISTNQLETIKIPSLSEEEIKNWSKKFRSLFDKIKILKQRKQRLEQLKKGLLNELL